MKFLALTLLALLFGGAGIMAFVKLWLEPRVPQLSDNGSAVYAATSRRALLDAALFAERFGIKPKLQLLGDIDRIWFGNGWIFNYTHPEAHDPGQLVSCVTEGQPKPIAGPSFVVEDPPTALSYALVWLHARGYMTAHEIRIHDRKNPTGAVTYLDTGGMFEPGIIVPFRWDGRKMSQGKFLPRFDPNDPAWKQ